MPKSTEELRRRIVADINAGVPGTKLGSERDLAERYSTSRSSLRQMLAALEEAGLVHRVIGRAGGIFISHAQVQRSLSDVVGVPAFLANQGYVAGTRVLSTKITAPDRTTQQALQIGADGLRRRDPAGPPGRRLAHLAGVGAVPRRGLSRAARKAARRLDLRDPGDRLRSRHLPRRRADRGGQRHAGGGRRCSAIKPRSALLLITRVTYDQNDAPCEFSRDLFRGDRTRLARHGARAAGIGSPVPRRHAATVRCRASMRRPRSS